ncbi:NAD(P)-binding protein [Boeremia exigua]|uniref:NAD(P)-binding protein n=1 Tax=Boeremia exigua TaxID=749465 RepID=UPI001E8ECCD0|nr:NAD(P)-binding protein [Boeremia exigua]KAH6622409.1 NAD(P)-binding protein [Boeremia exigua]
MPPKLPSTGSTGYIGGSVLHTLATAHPDWPITVLLRSVPPTFTSTYPSITIIRGDYDATETLSTAASNADIVVHCGNSDHEPSLAALLAGLRRKTTPAHLIHLSGTGLVSDWASPDFLGTLNPRVWSDVAPADLQDIRSLPDTALHRGTEKMLHAAAREGGNVRVCVMCPPDIYGRGKGLGRTRSALVPFFVAEARKRGGVFYVGDGGNARSWVHVEDLMRLYLRVVEAAAGGDAEVEKQCFGENGYFFAGTQEHSHIEIARAVGEVLARQGVVEDQKPVQIGTEELDGMANIPNFPKLARYLFASNSRTKAERAEKLWEYKGEAPGLMECLEDDVVDCLENGGR